MLNIKIGINLKQIFFYVEKIVIFLAACFHCVYLGTFVWIKARAYISLTPGLWVDTQNF